MRYLSCDGIGSSCSTENAIAGLVQCSPFLDYAAHAWGQHARGLNDRTVNDIAMKFLCDETKVALVGTILWPHYNRQLQQQSRRRLSGLHLC